MIPKQLAGDPRALVILDWSWLVRQAWSIGGIDRTASIVVGKLARLLSDPMPPSIVVAVDPDRGWTFRHRATADLPEKRRYKAGRQEKPPELVEINKRLLDVVRAHRIPILEPESPTREQDWEADDSGAVAARRAASEGRAVALHTADKDWLPLVQGEGFADPAIVRWNGNEKVDDEEAVIREWGVTPAQMTDLLSMMGDSGDNVPGVKGLGPKGAKEILTTHGSMDVALEAEPTTRWERLLHAQRDGAIFSRSLIQLWHEAPIQWDAPAQAVGDFDVRGLERLYRGFGFTRLAAEIPSFKKAVW